MRGRDSEWTLDVDHAEAEKGIDKATDQPIIIITFRRAVFGPTVRITMLKHRAMEFYGELAKAF